MYGLVAKDIKRHCDKRGNHGNCLSSYVAVKLAPSLFPLLALIAYFRDRPRPEDP